MLKLCSYLILTQLACTNTLTDKQSVGLSVKIRLHILETYLSEKTGSKCRSPRMSLLTSRCGINYSRSALYMSIPELEKATVIFYEKAVGTNTNHGIMNRPPTCSEKFFIDQTEKQTFRTGLQTPSSGNKAEIIRFAVNHEPVPDVPALLRQLFPFPCVGSSPGQTWGP